jgi:hypothetical protein
LTPANSHCKRPLIDAAAVLIAAASIPDGAKPAARVVLPIIIHSW